MAGCLCSPDAGAAEPEIQAVRVVPHTGMGVPHTIIF